MANRRQIKKEINYLCGDLFAECISCQHYTKANMEDIDNVMCTILHFHDDMICRVSHVEPGMTGKKYFQKLREDLHKQEAEIIEQINGLL